MSLRAFRFDAFCIDSEGNAYDFEVQNDSAGASPRRVRRNLSMMDAAHARKGSSWQELPDIYAIMFCEQDEIGLGEPISIYNFRRKGTGHLLGDGATVVYVNGQYRDPATALGRLIADFHSTNPSEMYSEILAKRAAYLKANGEEVSTMCNVMEEYAAEKAAEEVRKAEIKNTFNTTLNNIKQLMQNLGLSADKALAALGIDGPERQKYIAAL